MAECREFWKQIEKFMIENWIDFEGFCYICDISPQELNNFTDKNYDFKNDPAFNKICSVLKYFNKKKLSLESRFILAKISSKGKSVDLFDKNTPFLNNKSRT